jgi:serine/threonine protein kinase
MLDPFYMPDDSQALDQELRNLRLFLSVEGIVQLVAAVVSRNPYQTILDKPQVVLRDLLLEYHPNGTLEFALQSPQPNPSCPLQKWSLQISLALSRFHERGIAHMDFKPENVVINADDNAVLIDIGGIGVTFEYLAPEMHGVRDLLSVNVEIGMRHDIWALGKMISQMADISINNTEKQQLRDIALNAMAKKPSARTDLPSIISSLRRSS